MYLYNLSYTRPGMPVVMSNAAQSRVQEIASPFRSNTIQLDAGRMHFVDEGQGEILLFVHGLPTWSYIYRQFIASLSDTHRCIAIDNLGFGLSEKPADFRGLPRDHAQNLVEFIEKMDLTGITLIVHDFGGPIGLAAAIQAPGRINRIVAMNTWLWETSAIPAVKKAGGILDSWLGKVLYTKFNYSPRFLVPKGFYDSSKLSSETHRKYIDVFPDAASRRHVYILARSLLGSSRWYQDQYEMLEVLSRKPWLFVWGMKDRFITSGFLRKWEDAIPQAEVVELECGHFIQEECPEEAIDAIRNFINKTKNHE